MNRDVTLSGVLRATGPKPESASEHIRNARQMIRDAYFGWPKPLAGQEADPIVNVLVLADDRLDKALREIERGNP